MSSEARAHGLAAGAIGVAVGWLLLEPGLPPPLGKVSAIGAVLLFGVATVQATASEALSFRALRDAAGRMTVKLGAAYGAGVGLPDTILAFVRPSEGDGGTVYPLWVIPVFALIGVFLAFIATIAASFAVYVARAARRRSQADSKS